MLKYTILTLSAGDHSSVLICTSYKAFTEDKSVLIDRDGECLAYYSSLHACTNRIFIKNNVSTTVSDKDNQVHYSNNCS